VLDLPEAVIAGVLTSHGVAWGSLTPRLRDIAVKGHLPRAEIDRARGVFGRARPEQARILVLHHNVLRGELSQRMGLARWREAQRRIVASGAELVLCGHDHQELADVLDGVVVACAGTLSRRSRGGRPSVFFRIVVEESAIHVEHYRWDVSAGVFRRSHRHQFARGRAAGASHAAGAGTARG
jgi:predicted phosphodiesterase